MNINEAALKNLRNAKYTDEISMEDVRDCVAMLDEALKDSKRMDALSDPKFVFCFSITASGRCNWKNPYDRFYSSLRHAVDCAIQKTK